jgi:protein-L-isoaspartate(D-aspartate) O-methyltransferase
MHKYSLHDPQLDAELRAYLAEVEAEAKAAFHLRLRNRGVRDLNVLRAFERVSRPTFVPHRYLDLAERDLALPIDCGQTLDEPWLAARMVEALGVEPQHHVLEIGAGTGYVTAILAQLAADVVALERFQTLATAAQSRLAGLGVETAAVVWADGLDMKPEAGPFDRILVHGVLTALPDGLMASLADGGILVCARPHGAAQTIMRIRKAAEGVEERPICPCRLQPLQPGLAATL